MKAITIIEQQSGTQFTLYDNYLGSILRSFEGFEFPDVRESIDDVAGAYGSVYITSKFGRRRVGITGDLVSDDVYTLRKNLLTVLRQTGVIKLIKFTTYDDMNLQFEAEVVNFKNPYTHMVHTFMIELIAPDWRFYSQEETTREILQSSVRGGSAIPTAIPMSFGSPMTAETDLSNILINDGNEVTDPVFTITGPGTNFIVGNITTDKQFTFDAALSEGDEVVIDVKNRTVVLNGVSNSYPDIAGDFWSLEPGENEIRFFVESGLTADTKLTVVYRDAYSGI
jgi:hypothetical protein